MRRGAALVLSLVVVAAALASGKPYFWCVPEQRVLATCCCSGEADILAEEPQEAQLEQPCCCEPRNAGSLPPTRPISTAVASGPPGLPVDTVLPAPSAPERRARRHLDDPPRREMHGAARAGPLLASDRCVILQVWHC